MNGAGQGATLERILAIKDRFINTIKSHSEIIKDSEYPKSNSDIQVHIKLRPLFNQQFQSIYCFKDLTCLYYPSFQLLTDPGIDVHSYSFDGNHDDTVDHDQFFDSSCQGILEMIDVGGTGAIFAYGQTGSGKTFTISGVAERIVYSLPYYTHDITIRLLEVMGDVVRDLTTGEVVKVLVDVKGKAQIQGKSVANVVKNETEAQHCIQKGFAARKTIGTLKNNTSSRSHFICQIKMKHKETGKFSEVKLVDLAGSERNADTKNHDADRIKEAAYINISLMALKDCIRARQTSDIFRIPYRSSKLTILLKDVLDPQANRPSHLVMVATLSPSIVDIAHSLDTFRYAAALKPAVPLTERPTSKNSSTPMAWTTSRLSTWIETQTESQISLDDLLQNQPTGNFILPPWKYLYEMPEGEWLRCLPEKGKDLRLLYRSLFLKKRATTKSTEISAYPIETIMLLEDEKVFVKKDRNQEAMDKLKARGAAARLKASGLKRK